MTSSTDVRDAAMDLLTFSSRPMLCNPYSASRRCWNVAAKAGSEPAMLTLPRYANSGITGAPPGRDHRRPPGPPPLPPPLSVLKQRLPSQGKDERPEWVALPHPTLRLHGVEHRQHRPSRKLWPR